MADEHIGILTPDPRNARKHNPRNVGMLVSALQEVGAARSIVIDEDGVIIAGNATVEAAAQAGIKRLRIVDADGEEIIAVRRRGLTPEQKARLALYDNRVAELAEWDTDVLAELAQEVDLTGMWRDDELAALLANVTTEPVADPGAQVDRADELRQKWDVQPGDLWSIGRHRLLCGDCRTAHDVERLFGDDRASIVWTDPPYGVAVGSKNQWLNSIARSNRVEENLENDELDEDALSQMLTDAFTLATTVCAAGSAWYVAAPAGPLHLRFGAALNDLGILRQTIAWVKNNATFSPLGVSYHWAYEPIFYGWMPNGGHRWFGDRKQTTVWEIDRPQKSPEHPTMKPVELVARALQHSSLPGEIVYDPFVGSGTTIVAAEQEGRTAYAIDVAPKYVAVALERLAGMGLTPRRLD